MPDRQKIAKEFVTAWADYDSLLSGAFTPAREAATNEPRLHQAIGIIENSDQMKDSNSRRMIALQLAIRELSS